MLTLHYDSQLFQLATRFGQGVPRDLCDLTKKCFGSIITYAILAFLSNVVINALICWGLVLFFGWPAPVDPGMLFLYMAIFIFVIGLVLVVMGISLIGKSSNKISQINIIKTAYNGVKNKYCPLIKWV